MLLLVSITLLSVGINVDDINPKKLPDLPKWKLANTSSINFTFSQHEAPVRLPNGEFQAVYYSQKFDLRPGGVVFTNPESTVIEMPKGDNYISSVSAEFVYADTRDPVPLDEVYLHHWIFLNSNHPNDGVCGGYLKYIFGVGAETRSTPYDFPHFQGNVYGWISKPEDIWTANIHAMRTENMDPKWGLQKCIECHGPNEWCSNEGGFMCCPDKSHCPVVKKGDPSDNPKEYYMKYIVRYIPVEDEHARQGANFILDVSRNCHIEYNIKENPTNIDIRHVTVTLPFDVRFFQLWGHIHMAGYNMTLYHGGSRKDKPICSSYPIYGKTPGKVNDEKGYVVAMTKCMFIDTPYVVRKGEKLTLDTLYNVGPTDDRTFVSGFHDGVMGLFFMVGERCRTTACEYEEDIPFDREEQRARNSFTLHL